MEYGNSALASLPPQHHRPSLSRNKLSWDFSEDTVVINRVSSNAESSSSLGVPLEMLGKDMASQASTASTSFLGGSPPVFNTPLAA